MSSEKALDAGNPSNLGSAVTTAKSSAMEDFFRYALLKERLGAGSAILKAKSEKDEIMEGILGKIVNVRESSAEWSELVSLTGTENRFAQAEKLADIAWEKRRAELVLNKYTGGSAELDRVYGETQTKVSAFRTGGGLFGGGGAGGAPAPASTGTDAVNTLLTGGTRA